jgi:hypothetical protein
VRPVTVATMVALAVAGCHNPSRDDKPSPEFTSSPPLPPSPPAPSVVTTSGAAGASLARTVDAQAPVHDGNVACSAMTVPGAPGHGPEYIVMNTGNLGMKSCKVVFYAYGANGKQIARAEVEPISHAPNTDDLEPAQSVRGVIDTADATRAAKTPAPTWEAVVTEVRFADGTVWSSPGRAPAIRPSQAVK